MRDLLIKKEVSNQKRPATSTVVRLPNMISQRENQNPNRLKPKADPKTESHPRTQLLSLDHRNILNPAHLPFHAAEIFE